MGDNMFAEPAVKARSLEERISRILCTPELELDGNAYEGKYELNRTSIKRFILGKLRIKVKNLDTGSEIIVSKRTAKELAKHDSDGEIYQKSIAHISEIIEKMQFLEEMEPDKANPKFESYSYYVTGVNMDGRSYTILSTVGHFGNYIYYDQNVFDGTKQEVLKKAYNESKKYETEKDAKYSRFSKIMQKTEKGDWSQVGLARPEAPIT
jgi:hypothetical protein